MKGIYFQGRDDSKKRDELPAPGQYQVDDSTVKQKQSYTFGEKRDSKKDKSNPGPGSYQHQEHLGRNSKGVFSQSQYATKVEDIPAPGSYNVDEGFGS